MMPLPAVASAFPTLPHWPPSALPSKTPMLQTEVKCGLFLIIFFFFFFTITIITQAWRLGLASVGSVQLKSVEKPPSLQRRSDSFHQQVSVFGNNKPFASVRVSKVEPFRFP